ncbi:hypothetical protein CCACVL1_23884 [Corchorus capsularis]|uniref:Uncharacterized protein n=1 Tax=Corchorus capsularis TaxID=210143 RepID=A0A1R3GRW0_COCAP|nr:hypothetical protein CCACVL1_23884 [Corchorus capsularis]
MAWFGGEGAMADGQEGSPMRAKPGN